MTEPKDIRIFFSWQSDLPQDPTTRAIRNALREACSDIEALYPVRIILDEATRGVAGAANIPFEIARKIEMADIFVADITTVAMTESKKSLPNANVTFELGLSVAHLGWYRTILIFNKALAPLENLPFDFDRQRITTYSMPDSKESIRSSAPGFRSVLKTAVEHIVAEAPKRPLELKGKTETEIRRERDIANIKWFMRHISTTALDNHIREMPGMLFHAALFIYDGLTEVTQSIEFKLYDVDLEKLMRDIYHSLGETLKYDHYYRETNNNWVQAFGSPRHHGFADIDGEAEAAKNIIKSIKILDEKLRLMLDRLRSDYIEIDTNETNRLFHLNFKESMKID